MRLRTEYYKGVRETILTHEADKIILSLNLRNEIEQCAVRLAAEYQK